MVRLKADPTQSALRAIETSSPDSHWPSAVSHVQGHYVATDDLGLYVRGARRVSPFTGGTQASRSASVVLYEGARLIAGDGRAPIADSAFLVEQRHHHEGRQEG